MLEHAPSDEARVAVIAAVLLKELLADFRVDRGLIIALTSQSSIERSQLPIDERLVVPRARGIRASLRELRLDRQRLQRCARLVAGAIPEQRRLIEQGPL